MEKYQLGHAVFMCFLSWLDRLFILCILSVTPAHHIVKWIVVFHADPDCLEWRCSRATYIGQPSSCDRQNP